MTLGELTEETGVSVRTVRYYIAEGLLPPPAGAGPQSSYSPGHRDRLRLIQRMKEHYLPLKEIRRRLSGLDDDEVRTLLAEDEAGDEAAGATSTAWDASLAEARRYLAMLETRESYRTEPLPFQTPIAPSMAARAISDPDHSPAPARSRPPRPSGVFPARRPPADEQAAAGQELWRRIPLGDEAELVISDRLYTRHRDRVDWLVRWARKVFG